MPAISLGQHPIVVPQSPRSGGIFGVDIRHQPGYLLV